MPKTASLVTRKVREVMPDVLLEEIMPYVDWVSSDPRLLKLPLEGTCTR